MPTVKPRESRSAFVSRCIPVVIREGASQAHVVAKCGGIYEQAHRNTRITTNRTRVVPSNPLKADPTRSATLRRIFTTDISVRFARLKRKLWRLIVEQDAFGLTGTQNKERDNVLGNAVTSENGGVERRNLGTEAGGGQGVETVSRHQNSPGGEIRGIVESNRARELGESDSERFSGITKSANGENRRDGNGVRTWRTNKDGSDGNLTANAGVGNTQEGIGLSPTTNAGRWVFQTDKRKVKLFEKWLKTQVQIDILTVTKSKVNEAYWKKYVQQGYEKGAGRAFDDVRKPALASGQEQLAFFEGTKEEFLRQLFAKPVAVRKVKRLAERVFTGLKDVTDDMSDILTQQLTEGLTQGMNPREIARKMIKEGVGNKVRGVQSRAERIARTEIIRAHAEGQLDALEELGVTEVGVMVEWSTAGDDRVCPQCQPLDGTVIAIKEAKGILPRHPNCRCAYIPANVGESKKGQQRGKAEVKGAFDDSIRAERKKGSLAEKRDKSKWPGADKTIAKERPRSVLDMPEKPKKVTPIKPKALEPKPLPQLSKKDLGLLKEGEDIVDLVELELHKQDVLKKLSSTAKKASREKTRRWIRGLTKKQRKAIEDYTGEEFSSVRACLEDQDRCKGITKATINALKSALRKAPKFEGTSYRGLNLSENDAASFLARLRKNKGLTDKSFVSTSRSLPEARTFSLGGGEDVRIILKMEGKTGVDIAVISEEASELEVLFSPGNKFKLKSIGIDSGVGKFETGSGDILVTLVEVL